MAIPKIELEFGRKLTLKESKELFVNKIKPNKEFQKLIKVLNEFEENKMEILSANKTEFSSDNNVVTFITRLVLGFGNILIYYQLSSKEDHHREDITAAIIDVMKGESKTFFIKGSEIIETEFQHTIESFSNINFDQGLPANDDYVEGQSIRTIKPAYNWPDGCYPGYKHCGKNCGDKGLYGGGTPKNPYDTCCRTHDRCWDNFGANDCGCDCRLIECAKGNWLWTPPALHLILLAWFPRKANCRC